MFCLSVAAVATGCSTPYMVDRARDAADIFTATTGMGAGAKARVGPVQLGAIANADMLGLRGGKCGDVVWYETCTRDVLAPWPRKDGMFGEERFAHEAKRDVTNTRGKDFAATAPLPVLGFSKQPEYYTQIDIVIGVLGSLRLGFNPGELLDFILGWTTLDIYGDDLKETEEDEVTIAKAWLAHISRAGTPLSRAMAHMSDEVNFDGELVSDRTGVQDQVAQMRKLLTSPAFRFELADFRHLNKGEVDKLMSTSEHSTKYRLTAPRTQSMVLFHIRLTLKSTSESTTDEIYLGFDSERKLISMFD